MTSYNDFLSAISFDTPDVEVTGTIVERLDKNNIPELMLTEEQRQEYLAELLWSITDGRDVGYLKSQRVDLWDRFVDQASAIYGDYTPAQRLTLYGNEELAALFAEFIGDYIKDEPTEGYVPVYDAVINAAPEDRLDDNGVRVPTEPKIKHYVHADIGEIGHAWLDRQEVRGAPKELILGEIQSPWRQTLKAGLDLFSSAVQGEWIDLVKKLPFGEGRVIIIQALKRPIDSERLEEMLIDARLPGDVEDPQVVPLLDNFPRVEFELHVRVDHLHNLNELDLEVFQASILGQMLANSYGAVATTLNVEVVDCWLREDEVNVKLNALAEEEHNASHVFLPAKYMNWLDYAPTSFQFL